MVIGLCGVGLQNRLTQLYRRRDALRAQIGNERKTLRTIKDDRARGLGHWVEGNARTRLANEIIERVTRELATVDAELEAIERE